MDSDKVKKAAQNTEVSRALKSKMQDDSGSKMTELLNFDKILQKFKLDLQGLELIRGRDEDGNPVTVKKQKKNKMCNERCADMIVSILNTLLNTVTSTSHLNSKDVTEMGRRTEFALHRNIFLHYHEYEVDDTSVADIITNNVFNVALPGVKRSRGGRLLRHDEETTMTRKVITEDDSKNKWQLMRG